MKQYVLPIIAAIPVLVLHGTALFIALAIYGLVVLGATGGNTAKSYTTEQRLNNLVPIIFPNTGGQINGNVNVSGTHSANQIYAGGTSGGSASVTGTTAHFTSNTQTDGNHAIGGDANVSGQVNASAVAASGAMSSFGFTSHGGLSADGTLSAANFSGTFSGSHSGSYAGGQSRPGGYPIAHGTPWEDQVIDVINNIANVLVNAHVTN